MTDVHGDVPALPESWQEGVKVDWSDRPYGTTADYPEEFDADGVPVYVKKLNPAEEHQLRRDLIPTEFTNTDPFVDDGARLNTPENHRRKTVDAITTALGAAIRTTQEARKWAVENGYRIEKPVGGRMPWQNATEMSGDGRVVDMLREAEGTLTAVAELIESYENR